MATSAGRIVGAQSAKNLSQRAVRIRIHPGLRNIAESRHVLRMLKSYGDVSFYQSKLHDPSNPDPHTAIAIYQSPEFAANVISASPLHLDFQPPQPLKDVSSPATAGLARMFRTDGYQDDDVASTGQYHVEDEPIRQERKFYITAELSEADHLSRIQEKQHYWGFSQITLPFATQALRNRVPMRGMHNTLPLDAPPIPSRILRHKLANAQNAQTLREMWNDAQEQVAPGKKTAGESDF